jgi:sortase A
MNTLTLSPIEKQNKKRVLKLFPILFFSVSAAFFMQANWLQMKAVVAQRLIAHAWEATLLDPTPGLANLQKPWRWADFGPIAKLQWGDHKPVYVLSGTNGQALAFGPGHLTQSTEPGSQGQVIIAGHKDSHFAFLQNVQRGDALLLENRHGKTRRYTIKDKEIVDSRRHQLQIKNQDELVLITCYPFNDLSFNGPLRLVITAVPLQDFTVPG